MLFLMILFFLTKVTWCSNTGSAIFYKRLSRYDCWSEEDIAKLRARRTFEKIIPPTINPDKLDNKYIKETLKYFRRALQTVGSNEDKRTSVILKEVLADTLGSHIRSELLPTSRFAYYAGYIPYRRVRDLHDFYNSLKVLLNTQGLDWKRPDSVPKWTNLTVEKIRIGPGKFIDSCSYLVTKRDSRSCIHLPPPKLDDDNQPSALALPFKTGGLVSLESPYSENVLLKYYTTASRCILQNSPDRCRHSDFVNFNNDFWHWMKRDVAPHIVDEKLYAAYGGVLRIAAAVQDYGKGLSRRNLFAYQDAGVSKWHPWKALKDSYVYVNTDWTPHLYVFVILMIGFAICLLQICYSYFLGDDDACHCKGQSKRSFSSQEIAYATVDTDIPTLLQPSQSDRKHTTVSHSKTKTSSLGSIKTQKVYDMHENKEKLMAVIMSNSEDSSEDTPIPPRNNQEKDNKVEIRKDRSKSPPKIDTTITEMSCRTRTKSKSHLPMYSTTSTVTNSALTYQQVTDSWTASGSTTSAQSATSASSKSRCRRSRSSRDLVWARRVASKHAMHLKSTSGTELDVNSFTTPPSKG